MDWMSQDGILLVAWFYDPIKDVWLTSAHVEAGCAFERLS